MVGYYYVRTYLVPGTIIRTSSSRYERRPQYQRAPFRRLWHEQTPDGFTTHTIDDTLSQTHAVCLVDINGDGLKDFVTGKRWWAHMGKDPGSDQPALVVWYELSRKDGRPQWTRHQIDDDSGVGTQFEVADVNGDGLLDVVTSNKKGVYYFEQSRD